MICQLIDLICFLCAEIIMAKRGELAQTHVDWRGRWIQWVDSVGAKGAWQGHTLERKTLPKMRSKCAGVLRDWALVSLSLRIYVYIYVYVWRLQGCVAALVLCFIFSLFYFIFCWRTHTQTQAPFVCLFARILRLMNQLLPFTQVTKHKPKNAPKSSGRGLHLREIQRQSNEHTLAHRAGKAENRTQTLRSG